MPDLEANPTAELSVIIITRNGSEFAGKCLESVYAQDYKNFEIIVIDNGSIDDTAGFLKKNFPSVRIIENKGNLGACAARNQGVGLSRGRYILTLDCDITLARNFLFNIIQAAASSDERVGMIQPKILNSDGRCIYSSGISLSPLRRFSDIGRGSPDNGRFDEVKYIFGACSAAAFYKRRMLEDVKEYSGYFDERFFFLAEDVDLSWRAQKKGWKALYYPQVVCYHSGNSSKTAQKTRQYLCFRNRYYLIIKNDRFDKLIPACLLMLAYDSLRFFYLLFTNPRILKAIGEIIRFVKDDYQHRNPRK